jgi:hypothetical protein
MPKNLDKKMWYTDSPPNPFQEFKTADIIPLDIKGLFHLKAYFHIFLLSRTELVWRQVIRELCESDRGCPVIELAPSTGHN